MVRTTWLRRLHRRRAGALGGAAAGRQAPCKAGGGSFVMELAHRHAEPPFNVPLPAKAQPTTGGCPTEASAEGRYETFTTDRLCKARPGRRRSNWRSSRASGHQGNQHGSLGGRMPLRRPGGMALDSRGRRIVVEVFGCRCVCAVVGEFVRNCVQSARRRCQRKAGSSPIGRTPLGRMGCPQEAARLSA